MVTPANLRAAIVGSMLGTYFESDVERLVDFLEVGYEVAPQLDMDACLPQAMADWNCAPGLVFGRYSPKERLIRIRAGLDARRHAFVLAHECGHALRLHERIGGGTEDDPEEPCDVFASTFRHPMVSYDFRDLRSRLIFAASMIFAQETAQPVVTWRDGSVSRFPQFLPSVRSRAPLTLHYIEDADSIARYGVYEEDLVMRDVRVMGTSATDRKRAANAMYGRVVKFLLEHKDPLRTYAVKPVGMKHLVEGTDVAPVCGKYPVWFRGWRKEGANRRVWIEIDEDLYLMRRERLIDASGRSTWSLGFSTTTREMPTDSEETAAVVNELKAAVAARLPMISWGGNPPTGRLAPEGIQLHAPDDPGIGTNIPRKVSWYLDGDFTDLLAEVSAQYEDGDDGMGGSITAATYMKALVARSIDGQFEAGFYDYEGDEYDTIVRLRPSTDGAAIQPFQVLSQADGEEPLLELLELRRVGDDEWALYQRKNGALVRVGGGMKVINGGYYLIPAGPSIGTGVASSASANAYGSWTEMRSASGNALYIVGGTIQIAHNDSTDYVQIDIGTGAAAAEVSASEVKVIGRMEKGAGGFGDVFNQYGSYDFRLPFPVAVAASTRIACRTADDVGSALTHNITLHVVDQADVESL